MNAGYQIPDQVTTSLAIEIAATLAKPAFAG